MTGPHATPLIDRFLPDFQFRERHALTLASPPAALLDAVLTQGVADDPWTRTFLQLRELPARLLSTLGLRDKLRPNVAFGIDKFMHLGRDAERELVLGLAGRFWQSNYGLIDIEQPELRFPGYIEPGIAKLVLNFSTEPLLDGRTRLITETRVYCVDAAAFKRFRPYWMLIRPISGLIRRRLLVRIGRFANFD